MPEEKGNVDPLLGQSFFKHFKVEYSPEARTLNLKRLETADSDGATASATDPDASGQASKAASKSRRPSTRQSRASTKSRRPARSQPTTDGGEPVFPDTIPAGPN
jgi:hypothetical protein